MPNREINTAKIFISGKKFAYSDPNSPSEDGNWRYFVQKMGGKHFPDRSSSRLNSKFSDSENEYAGEKISPRSGKSSTSSLDSDSIGKIKESYSDDVFSDCESLTGRNSSLSENTSKYYLMKSKKDGLIDKLKVSNLSPVKNKNKSLKDRTISDSMFDYFNNNVDKTIEHSTPTRFERRYTFTGVNIREIDEGQLCDDCSDCGGFVSHPWRKTCSNCKCPREAHAIYHEEFQTVSERLGFKFDPSSLAIGNDSAASADPIARTAHGVDPRAFNYAWVPPGLDTSTKIDEYFRDFPSEKIPRIGTSGERYRDKQLALQLPKQDLALAYCKHVESQHHSSYEDFVAARNEIALDIGYVSESPRGPDSACHECSGAIAGGQPCVRTARFGTDALWHPHCFVCSECREPLVDLAHCVRDGQLFCERHYAETLKPRCAACDELIFSGEYTKAMSKDWHGAHFCCWQCDESLTGQRYVLRDDHPYCVACYESVFANACEECNKIIGIDSKDLSYKDKHWHEACFLCSKCRVSLVDKQFGSKLDKIYCGNCYDAQFASRCDGCGEIFRAGTKKMEYKTRQWHEKCFCCCVCKTAIGTKSFIPREQEIYCAGCYEEKFATRCVKCNKIITSGGVTYKNEPWHRECFTCSHCNTSLAGQRFTSRDDKPYCAECFGELFAKRCTACSKPITGIGGTRFISFEERHWHNDCFVCASCNTSLVGRGFITDNQDIICPDCAKQKLM